MFVLTRLNGLPYWLDQTTDELLPFIAGAVDNVTADPGAGGAVFATDDIAGVHYPIEKLAYGPLDTATLVTATVGLPIKDDGSAISVDDNAGSLTIDNAALSTTGGGVEAGALRVTLANDSTGLVSVDDNAGSLTVDNATLSVTGGGVEAGALRVTIANDSTGVVSIDDNGGAITVDGTVSVTEPVSVDDNAGSLTVDAPAGTPVAVRPSDGTTAQTFHELDLDTGAGVQTRIAVGIAGAASAGSVAVQAGGGTEATALRVTLANDSTGLVSVDDNGGNLSVDWAGTVPPIGAGTEAAALRVTVATDSTGVLSVDDNAGSLTVDNATLSVTGGGVEAGALRVTLANDSTGLVSVDDNAGSLTVDNATLSVTGGGVEASALRVTIANDSTGVLSVDDNAGALTVDQTTAANLNAQVVGDVAHDGIDAGNPIKIGAKAAGALPAAVAALDRVDAYFDREGRQITRPYGAGTWIQVNFPAANTRATTTKTAGAAGVRHVCTSLTAVLGAGATAPTAIQLDVRVRDGIADTGTILWQAVICLPATAGAMNGIALSGLHITGTAATAMTMEFSAAGGANTFESVTMHGYDITEA